MRRAAPRMRRCSPPPRLVARGFTLLEVLIALVVLSIGMLGLAALQTTSLQFSTSSYYRTQATTLAYELADRMRANRQAAMNNVYDGDFEDPPPSCDATLPVTTPASDIIAWRSALACRLPRGTASVTFGGGEVTIIVQWDDRRGQRPAEEFQLTTGL